MDPVLVIGAGLAGLSCARELTDAGVPVIVLEARDRVGGRLSTERRALGVGVDMGASWIHGSVGNPLTLVCDDFKLGTRPCDHSRRRVFGSGGVPIENPLPEFWGHLNARRTELKQDCSVAELLVPHAEEIRELEWCLSFLAMVMGAGAAELSAKFWDQDEELPAPDLNFPGGFQTLAERLAVGIEVRTEQIVRGIRWDYDGAIAFVGDAPQAASACVISLPLGVLRAGAVEFEPTLGPARWQAAQALGVGVLAKVALEFPQVFWPEDVNHIGVTDPGAACPGFVNLAGSGRPILVGYAGGVHGITLERMAEDTLRESVCSTLERVFGSVPEPVGITRTSWHADPFARGSYSHIPVGATGAEYQVLAAPAGALEGEAEGPVFFAGEHTHRQYPCTAHGAYLSGQRAAREVLSRLGKTA